MEYSEHLKEYTKINTRNSGSSFIELMQNASIQIKRLSKINYCLEIKKNHYKG